MIRFLTLSLTLLLTSACLSNKAPAIKLYVLHHPASVSADNDAQYSVELSRVNVAAYLDRPQIVSRRGQHQLHIAEYHQWAGNLQKDLMNSMSNNLAQQLPQARLYSATHRASRTPNYRVQINILSFEHQSDGHVHLDAQWQVIPASPAQPLPSQQTRLVSEQTIKGDDYKSIVTAMSQLYITLSAGIAKQIQHHRGQQ